MREYSRRNFRKDYSLPHVIAVISVCIWLVPGTMFGQAGKKEMSLGYQYLKKGEAFRVSGDGKKALEMYTKALYHYQKAGSDLGRGEIHFRIAYLYFQAGLYNKALPIFDRALPFYKKAKYPLGLGNIYLYEGFAYKETGRSAKAIEMFNKALPFLKKAGVSSKLGLVYYNIGDIYMGDGNSEKALEMFALALPFALDTNDDMALGKICYSRGLIYTQSGKFSKAIDMYNKAMVFFVKTGYTAGQGGIYIKKGKVYTSTGENEKAIEMYGKALPFYRGTGSAWIRGLICSARGELLFDTGKYDEALGMFDNALASYEIAGKGPGRGNAYYKKGKIYSETGKNDEALEMFEKARPFFENKGDYWNLGLTYYNMAGIYFQRQNMESAAKWGEKALLCIDKFPGNKKMGVFYNMIALYLDLANKDTRALEIFDRALALYKSDGDVKGEADVYYGQGDIYRGRLNYKKSLELFRRAADLFKTEGNKDDDLARAYLKISEILFATEKYDKANGMCDKAISLYEKSGNLSGQGNAYDRKGDVYFNMGKRQKALEMYNKALSLFSRAGDEDQQSFVYYNISRIYFFKGDNLTGRTFLQKGLDISLKDGSPIAAGLNSMAMGMNYMTTGDTRQAVEMFRQALPFCEKSWHPFMKGRLYVCKGYVSFYSGQYAKAMEMYDKALPFLKDGGINSGMGDLCFQKAQVYTETGDIANALDMLNKALEFYYQDKDHVGTLNVYRYKGVIFRKIGKFPRALDMHDKAIALSKEIGMLTGLAAAYWRKGIVLAQTGDHANALDMYDKALSYSEKTGSRWGVGSVLGSKAELYLKTGDVAKALETSKKSLRIYLELGAPPGQAHAYQIMGDAYFADKNREKALEMYDNALALHANFVNIDLHALTLFKKAVTLSYLKRTGDALPLYEQAVAMCEKFRSQTAFSNLKQSFMETLSDRYEYTAGFMLENKYYHQAFKIAESLKARGFLDQLAEGASGLEKGIDPELKRKKDVLVAKLSLMTKELQNDSSKINKKERQKLELEYREVEKEFQDILVKIHLQNPLYASVRYPEPVSARQLQQTVLKKDEVLLRYFIAGGDVYVFVLSTGDFNAVTVDADEKWLGNTVNRFLFSLNSLDRKRGTRYGKILYEKLFKPVEPFLEGNKTIIFIPDGPLAKIPFEALVIDKKQTGKPLYLLEKFRVKYIQSASALAVLRKQPAGHGNENRFTGFGDPVYTGGQSKLAQPGKRESTPDRGRFERLEYSGREVNAIAKLFEKSAPKAVVYLREDASEENAKAAGMNRFDYIHFACHGILGDRFQSLVLSQVPNGKEDGYFILNEIMNCDYNAKLIVLSACRTGTGKMQRAEGVTGLTRAVMYAGTPAAVASLWNVSDIGTKELMVKFYENILEKRMTKEDALRTAKIEMINSAKYSLPFYWSAFVMYGE